MIFPFIKDGKCHYRDAGFFKEELRLVKRFFLLSQYVYHYPHDFDTQIIVIQTPYGERMLSSIGHCQTFERLIHGFLNGRTYSG